MTLQLKSRGGGEGEGKSFRLIMASVLMDEKAYMRGAIEEKEEAFQEEHTWSCLPFKMEIMSQLANVEASALLTSGIGKLASSSSSRGQMVRPSLAAAFETPSTQFARLGLASCSSMAVASSSIHGTPVAARHHCALRDGNGLLDELHYDDDDDAEEEDEIGNNLAEILASDCQEHPFGPSEVLLEPIEEVTILAEMDQHNSLLTGTHVPSTLGSSSMPQSPCKKPWTPIGSTGSTGPLADRSNTQMTSGKRRQHWSSRTEDEDKAVPIPKLRRTASELHKSLNLVTLMNSPLPRSIEQPAGIVATNYDDLMPWHKSPKDAIGRVTPATVAGLLDGSWSHTYDRLLIIDARYPYEFLGGHIPTALNICSTDAAQRLLFSPELLTSSSQRTLLVFHCEFSSERGPRLALDVRQLDRQVNAEAYPKLCFPSMFIMEGGYRAWWQEFGPRCDPPGQYLPMRATRFRDDMRFHQRMKATYATKPSNSQQQQPGTGGFQGDKYMRSKVRACTLGVGLRKTASATHMSIAGSSADMMQGVRLAPGESMPEDFPSSDGPDISHGAAFIHDAARCFL